MTGNNYLIVGGSSGIGLSLVKLLLDEGANVFVASRSNDFQQDVFGVEHIYFDATENEAFNVSQLPEHLHGVVYAPGTINLKPFHRIKEVDFLHEYHVNFLGAVKVLQACFDKLKSAENASVICFSTVAVQSGMPFHSSIASAKGAVEGLVRSLAAEWSPKIRVNAIAPSLTQTPLAEKLLSTPEKVETSAQRHPLKIVGQPEDMAEMALFLLSQKSKFITGQIIGIDGGMGVLKV